MDSDAMGNLRDEAQSEVLFADQGRHKATRCRGCELGEGDGAREPLPGGGVVKPRFAAARLLALFRKRRLDRELEGEIFAHLEMAELDAVAAGLSPEEARRQARRGFGGIEQMKEDHRDQRSVRRMENLWRDVRYGVALVGPVPALATVTFDLVALGT